jgi:hypothetical protein
MTTSDRSAPGTLTALLVIDIQDSFKLAELAEAREPRFRAKRHSPHRRLSPRRAAVVLLLA